jgi:hypothetical protein
MNIDLARFFRLFYRVDKGERNLGVLALIEGDKITG